MTATGCNHPYPDLQWPEHPRPRKDGRGWLWHCTCRRCGETVFRTAREPGADKYGLQPEVRAKVDAAWAEFDAGEDVRWRRDRAALVQRLTQAYRLHRIRALFATGQDGGNDCAPLSTAGRAAESAAVSAVSNRTHPPAVFRPRTGWLRWLHDKRLDERRAREYVVVGAWLTDPAQEAFREAVKRPDARPEDLKGWSEVLAEARGWRRDTEAQRAVEAVGQKVTVEARHASDLRRVYDDHLAAGRERAAEQMQETLDGAAQRLAAARDTLQHVERLRDRLPRPVEPGAVTVRLREDGPGEEVKGEVEALLRPLRPFLERHRLAATVLLKAAEPEPRGA